MKSSPAKKPLKALDSKSSGKVAFESGGAITLAILIVIIIIGFTGNLLFHWGFYMQGNLGGFAFLTSLVYGVGGVIGWTFHATNKTILFVWQTTKSWVRRHR